MSNLNGKIRRSAKKMKKRDGLFPFLRIKKALLEFQQGFFIDKSGDLRTSEARRGSFHLFNRACGSTAGLVKRELTSSEKSFGWESQNLHASSD
jgi:hypothetical protein